MSDKEPIRAEILTIGDEILYGQILDTNSQWISEKLDSIGVRIVSKTTVGDNETDIIRAFNQAENRANLVLITGGLGPTADDLTKPCLAKFFNCEIKTHPIALKNLKELFEKRGFSITETNLKQADLPEKCEMIPNPHGSAPGMWFDKDQTVIVSMPGVPHEMKSMMTDEIIPRLRMRFHTPVIYHRMIKTVGIGESWLSDKIKQWESGLPPHIKLAYLPNFGQVRLRLTATGKDRKILSEEVQQEIEKLRPYISKYIFGYDRDLLEAVVGRLLTEKKLTISSAESCTGGYVAHCITSVPGSSRYFRGSIVAYDNEIKIAQLGVNPETLARFGAVSEETIKEMAEKIRMKLKTEIGIATSGIAGPSGGTADKPVGTVWIAYADAKKTLAKKLLLTRKRDVNIRYTSVFLLNMVRQTLTEND